MTILFGLMIYQVIPRSNHIVDESCWSVNFLKISLYGLSYTYVFDTFQRV